ncbi:protein adenylyltransferase SelO [Shimia ponticola]|uniref:protein adenylyltransferase SelO n=1 Tax=Shimia ponticola TaxID=2582893 RepID=UPI0011BFD259|nr:YdiU family protein [Shimia ponticola]
MTQIAFDNSYARLPSAFYTKLPATPVREPTLRAWNADLAEQLGLPDMDMAERAAIFGGNDVPDGAEPLAALYAGHQFGNWNPQLGDGRAILLGEILDQDGGRWDIQLKGSGPTPYSRAGDGRNWVGPALREYLVSEAMAALGIPTTRALALVTTGETVLREAPLPGAIVTRVASSHIRVGTFQVFAARGQIDDLRTLADHVMDRHYPTANDIPDLLRQVVQAQAELIAQWMSVGFIHGVMNTDNAHVAGDTIDYGPCAFMDDYHPARVFSSIDHGGRYAYANQPNIGAWNMAQFATALLPLMPDRDAAIEDFTAIVNGFADAYQTAWRQRFGAKIGLGALDDAGVDHLGALLSLMTNDGADFTNTFNSLSDDPDTQKVFQSEDGKEWLTTWRGLNPDLDKMSVANPQVIPRNHLVEAAIQAAVSENWSAFNDLNHVLSRPFERPQDDTYTRPPEPDEVVHQTFCGT